MRITLIDDIDDSLALMTPLGRTILGGPAQMIQQAVLSVCGSSVDVIDHASFARWASTKSTCQTVCLDPLLRAFDPSWTIASCSRVLDGGAWQVQAHLPPSLHLHGPIRLLDDASSTGSTLTAIARALTTNGVEISSALLACCSSEAQGHLQRAHPDWQLCTFSTAPGTPAHLRDSLGFLPHSGRMVHSATNCSLEKQGIAVRVPPMCFRDSAWEKLLYTPRVRKQIVDAHRLAVDALDRALGRSSLVRDVTALGPNVAVPLFKPIESPGQRLRDAVH